MSIPCLPAVLAAVLLTGAALPDEPGTTPLSLAEAVLISESLDDPGVAAWRHRAEALERRGVAESALPDTMVRAGLANVPLSDFDPNREAMTQAQIGVRQAFPRGDTRRLRRDRRAAEAEGARAGMALEAREIRRSVRETWLEIYYWERARELTAQRREEIAQLGEIATAVFASGRSNSHDVLRVDLETAMLDTRLLEIRRETEAARADLARYLGDAADRPLTPAMPALPSPPLPSAAVEALVDHPQVLAHNARIEASQREIELAQQAFRPAWSVDAGYGLRGSRSDVASIGVSVEMPLFGRSEREDGVAGARQARSAEELERHARLLDLRRQLERTAARHARLLDMIAQYETAVLDRAQHTAEAVLLAYRNERADFAELVRAELALLDAQLAILRLQVDARQAQAEILYLTGDVQ